MILYFRYLFSAIAFIAFSLIHGGILTGVSVDLAVPSVDLSAEGTSQWAVWNIRVDGGQAAFARTHSKASGTGTVSSLTALNGTTNEVRGTDSLINYPDVFTWTPADASGNSLPPADGKVTGIFNTDLEDAGNGVKFNITDLPTLSGGQYYQVNVYASTFRGRGQFSVNQNLGTAATQLGGVYETTKETDRFSFGYNPDDITDSLNLSFSLYDNFTSSSNHSVIQAVAISVVPEPASLWFALGGMLILAVTFYQRKG